MDDAGCAIRRALVKVADVELALAILMMATWFSFMEGNLWLIGDIVRVLAFPIAILWKKEKY
jgi:hypothetical protein